MGNFTLCRRQPLALACTYVSATVTPTGVREGDPAALAALCAVRGPSVVAYCRHVAGEAEAGAAAADAFARFRVAVVAAGDTSSLNPEALLISATRTSAAARADITAPGHCSHVPALLAARAEKTIDAGDLLRLEAHLEQCWACRAPVARFKAAERAYRDPPEKTVEPALAAQIVEALIAAVPPAPPPEATAPSVNGAAPAAEAEAEATPPEALDQPTEHFATADAIEPELAEEAAAYAEAEAAEARRRRRAKRTAGAGSVLARLRPAAASRGPRAQPEAAAPPVPGEPAAARERREPSRGPLRLAVVLPIVLVLLALLAALYVSGVFGGSDPASSPRVSAPVAVPAQTEPEVVAVPGAKDASADAVETAKARARGEGRSADSTKKQKATRTDSAPRERAPAAAAPPPAAAPRPASPAVSANNPVTPPPPPRDTGAGDEKQIDAGSGATGAEQIPPAADPTGVPDLAPPPETTTP